MKIISSNTFRIFKCYAQPAKFSIIICLHILINKMRSSHESFYQVLKEYGGTIVSSNQPSHLKTLSEFAISTAETIRDGINQQRDILWPLGDIKVEFVSNSAFNAF